MAGRTGIWLIGAWGGVSTTVAAGLAALRKGLSDTTGLVSSLPAFEGLNLANWDTFVIGGHEIRETNYATAAKELHNASQVFSLPLLDTVATDLEKWDKNVRVGSLINVGSKIESFASAETRSHRGESTATVIERVVRDLDEFRTNHKLDHVVVVNLASTEPPIDHSEDKTPIQKMNWKDLSRHLNNADGIALPASSVYGMAAMQAGCSYVNFTPSIGTDLPGLCEFAELQNALHAGRDGKTGETLLKSVLAPMFAARNLNVMSWVGHNIFGNMDGQVLDDPINKATKVSSKDHLLTEILGYKPQSLVSIEYIDSLGDWKTAWDHIHFQGFLGTKMAMQFTWQGCDSLLAAPLVLDLVRFTEREHRRGKTCGVMTHLASFFKSPMGQSGPEFAQQFARLKYWSETVAAEER